ncbi:hypothetical protein BH09PLA1_BH09PLA1_36210 [soil metagenome]
MILRRIQSEQSLSLEPDKETKFWRSNLGMEILSGGPSLSLYDASPVLCEQNRVGHRQYGKANTENRRDATSSRDVSPCLLEIHGSRRVRRMERGHSTLPRFQSPTSDNTNTLDVPFPPRSVFSIRCSHVNPCHRSSSCRTTGRFARCRCPRDRGGPRASAISLRRTGWSDRHARLLQVENPRWR